MVQTLFIYSFIYFVIQYHLQCIAEINLLISKMKTLSKKIKIKKTFLCSTYSVAGYILVSAKKCAMKLWVARVYWVVVFFMLCVCLQKTSWSQMHLELGQEYIHAHANFSRVTLTLEEPHFYFPQTLSPTFSQPQPAAGP